MTLLLSLVAGTLAVMVAVAFFVARGEQDVAITIAAGTLLLYLLVVSMLGLRLVL